LGVAFGQPNKKKNIRGMFACQLRVTTESKEDSSYSASSESDQTLMHWKRGEYDEEDNIGVSWKMVGNRITAIEILCQMIHQKNCCRNCAVKNHPDYRINVLVFGKGIQRRCDERGRGSGYSETG